ncbi:hypothetical protein B0H16DRAFT_1464372 [Mycena metata]|uniref:Uncharacterized protein n=1 Tax=Mycena metata TaxID=1033252 RepID=A0AAD7IH62_9AGAR|nr:hypothetical protein B0H16DRAFT_1464372 [Mycena metata]
MEEDYYTIMMGRFFDTPTRIIIGGRANILALDGGLGKMSMVAARIFARVSASRKPKGAKGNEVPFKARFREVPAADALNIIYMAVLEHRDGRRQEKFETSAGKHVNFEAAEFYLNKDKNRGRVAPIIPTLSRKRRLLEQALQEKRIPRSLSRRLESFERADEGGQLHYEGISFMNIAQVEVLMGVSYNMIQEKIDALQVIFNKIGHKMMMIACNTIQADLNLREGDMSCSLFCQCLKSGLGRFSEIITLVGGHIMIPHGVQSYLHTLSKQKRLGIYKALQFIGDVHLMEDDEVTAVSLFTVALEGFTYMDVHRSRAECMIRLGDVAKKDGDLLKALEQEKRKEDDAMKLTSFPSAKTKRNFGAHKKGETWPKKIEIKPLLVSVIREETWVETTTTVTIKIKCQNQKRPLFECSPQAKRVQDIEERVGGISEEVKEQHQKNLALLAELNVHAEKVEDVDSHAEELELEEEQVGLTTA